MPAEQLPERRAPQPTPDQERAGQVAWDRALNDPLTVRALDAGAADIAAGRTQPWSEVRARLVASDPNFEASEASARTFGAILSQLAEAAETPGGVQDVWEMLGQQPGFDEGMRSAIAQMRQAFPDGRVVVNSGTPEETTRPLAQNDIWSVLAAQPGFNEGMTSAMAQLEVARANNFGENPTKEAAEIASDAAANTTDEAIEQQPRRPGQSHKRSEPLLPDLPHIPGWPTRTADILTPDEWAKLEPELVAVAELGKDPRRIAGDTESGNTGSSEEHPEAHVWNSAEQRWDEVELQLPGTKAAVVKGQAELEAGQGVTLDELEAKRRWADLEERMPGLKEGMVQAQGDMKAGIGYPLEDPEQYEAIRDQMLVEKTDRWAELADSAATAELPGLIRDSHPEDPED